MQNHQQRKEGIEMDVKAVAPLHVLTTRRLDNQVSVRHQPSHSHNKIRQLNEGSWQTDYDNANSHITINNALFITQVPQCCLLK